MIDRMQRSRSGRAAARPYEDYAIAGLRLVIECL
jgi:hypothetical protein